MAGLRVAASVPRQHTPHPQSVALRAELDEQFVLLCMPVRWCDLVCDLCGIVPGGPIEGVKAVWMVVMVRDKEKPRGVGTENKYWHAQVAQSDRQSMGIRLRACWHRLKGCHDRNSQSLTGLQIGYVLSHCTRVKVSSSMSYRVAPV
jgi:hypothetical protein